MAILVSAPSPSNANDAFFRSWTKAINDALIFFGWVHVPCTGEADLDTMTAPAAANTYANFRVYRMNDSLQATYPLFLRITFGSGAAADRPSARWELSDGVDTSNGSLGTMSTALMDGILTSAAGSTTVPATSYFSGDAGRFVMALFNGAASTFQWYVCIQRSPTDRAEPSILFLAASSAVAVTTDILRYRYPITNTRLTLGMFTNQSRYTTGQYDVYSVSPLWYFTDAAPSPMSDVGADKLADFTEDHEWFPTAHGITFPIRVANRGQVTSWWQNGDGSKRIGTRMS